MSLGGVSSSSSSDRLVNVGLHRSVEQGGKFKIKDGSIGIQRTGGKIKITKTITAQGSLEAKDARQNTVREFKTQKDATKWLKTHKLSEGESVAVVKEYKSEKKAEAWLERSALSTQEKIAANAMNKIEESFANCTAPQQAYIKEYAQQMIEGGDKPEFALQVCQAMALLYKEGMESLMPDSIKIRDTVASDTQMRMDAVSRLAGIMAANGGDYEIMQNYLEAQQLDSNAPVSMAVRHFMSMQRQDPNEEHFLPESEAQMQAHFSQLFSGNEEKCAKTIAMYKAFTAIALNKAHLEPDSNHQNHTCTLYRGIQRDILDDNYPGYNQTQNGDTFTIRHTTLESTSVGRPIRMFNPKGSDTHTMEVPYSRIFAAYFMSPEMCGNAASAHEHEFVCDLSGIPAQIKCNRTEEDIAGYEISRS
jgi:hypothetical protein